MERYTENNGLVQLHFVPSFFLQIPPGESIGSVQSFAFVLDCISMLFRSLIPQIGQKPLLITNDSERDGPICYRTIQQIILNTEADRYSQIAYQYAHELCHYAIPDDVDQNLRWFEEAICEMASLSLLHAIGNLWISNNVDISTSDGNLYAHSFIRYSVDTSKNYVVFDLKDPAIRNYLETNCYDRKRNRFLANNLMSVFEHYPGTWSAIPLLNTIHQQSLEEALDEWIRVSPSIAQPGLREIRALF